MPPFHDEPVIRENIITKILFASCSAKISYRKKFRVYSISFPSAAEESPLKFAVVMIIMLQ